MSPRGFIALARGIMDHPTVGTQKPFSPYEAWHWMLFEAAFKPRRVRIGGGAVELERGQLAHSERFLADKWGWSKSRVHRFLDKLETEAMVSRKTDHETNLITICKYDEYQQQRTGNEPDSEPHTGPAADQQRTKEEQLNKVTTINTPSLRSGEGSPEAASAEQPKSKPRRAKARTPIADDWTPTERDIAHAASLGFATDQISSMAAGFADHHRARGNLMADWSAAWRTWCGNEIKFNRSMGNGPGRPRPLQDDSKSVSRAIDAQIGKLSFPARPRLVPDAGENNLRLLPEGRGSGS